MINMLLQRSKGFFATLALVEHNGKQLSKNTLKLLTAASKLQEQTHLLVCGPSEAALQDSIKLYAGSHVTKVLRASIPNVLAEQVSTIIKGVLQRGGYNSVVGLSTNLGKDIIPRVAGQHGSQPISDIIEVCSPNIFLRPTYAGNALTKVESSQKVNFLTFRASNFDEASEAEGSPMVEDLDVAGEVRTSLVSEDSDDSGKPDLTTARIVVSGGRGVKSKENFSIISKLADAFGDAAVGASRAAVDAGYCPNDMQVGQTGKVVAPELYLAFGISGAVQHLAGMKDSKVIVAVNTNPDEPIFEVANYGLEGDLFKVVPELTQKVAKIKGK